MVNAAGDLQQTAVHIQQVLIRFMKGYKKNIEQVKEDHITAQPGYSDQPGHY